jgi:dimeric dUTPase (all-alpha-NTP-PPase superfamily)
VASEKTKAETPVVSGSLGAMLDAQRALQLRFSHDFEVMSVEDRVAYISESVLALTDEAHEALRTTTWKSWTHGPRKINRDAYLAELADAFHWLLNLYLAVNATPSEIVAGYYGKNKINHERQDSKYTGLESCPACQRELTSTT